MQTWLKISLLLSIFGFLKEFRPSEPFIYEFLTGPWKNFTSEQVNKEIFPIGTYSYLVSLVFVFLITDLCRYKPLIVLLGVCGMIIWSMLLWTKTLFAIQIMEIFYGLANATEVAYYTYMYAKVSREHYTQVTSHARSATLIGRFLAATIAQLVISYELMNYRDLNYFTLSSHILATIWALMLPSVPKSIYFHQETTETNSVVTKLKNAFALLWEHFKTSYSSSHVIKWSLWWALATCGYIQVCVYMQTLWGEIVGKGGHQLYNGAVEALLTLLGALGSLAAGAIKVNWSVKGELVLGICSVAQGLAIYGSTVIFNIWVSYTAYVFFGMLYQFLITVASSEVAKKLPDDCYGLIFGMNTLLALILQTLLTLAIVSTSGFSLGVYSQYIVYGVLHIVLGSVFVIMGIVTWTKSKSVIVDV